MTHDKLERFEGSASGNGNCSIAWNLDYNKLYSPDGLQQLLPCERCGAPQWCIVQACSVLCADCTRETEDLVCPTCGGEGEGCRDPYHG